MKKIILLSSAIIIAASIKVYGQKIDIQKLQNGFTKTQKWLSSDSLKKARTAVIKNISKDSIHKEAKSLYYGDAATVFHIGWEDGRAPEFSNAYVLHRHEFRLNVLGRSSFAISSRLEISSCLPLIVIPNVAFKYQFFDSRNFTSALELGTAGGAFPVAFAEALPLPGVIIGAGTAGFIRGSDNHLKLYASWHPAHRLTFSVRSGVSFLKIGYSGVAGAAGIGGGGAFADAIPINVSQRFIYLMGGFEADYVINKKNVIVLNSFAGGFAGGKSQLIVPSLGWTHAKTHFHYTLGLYTLIDPPSYQTWNAEKSKQAVGAYANVYWVFNNRVRK